jgi:O-acetyl-ADP-ribose deacetylase (regulator of RNase III)
VGRRVADINSARTGGRGVDWNITKQKFPNLQGVKVTLDMALRRAFRQGGTGRDGRWRLNINP